MKSFTIAVFALLHVFGYTSLPAASIVALGVVQSFSLMGCMLGWGAATSKAIDKSASSEMEAQRFNIYRFGSSVSACMRALMDNASVSMTIWSITAVVLAKILRFAGFNTSPLSVLVSAFSIGALCQRVIPALVGSPPTCRKGADSTIWPSLMLEQNGEEEMESPLASMAKDVFVTPIAMQSPLFDMEDED